MSLFDELSELEEARLRAEWALTVALRETLDIATRRDMATTYRQAINFGEAVAPTVLGKQNRILLGYRESNEARKYAELALVESARTGIPINRIEYIDREIEKLTNGLAASSGMELHLVERELDMLKRIRLEVTPKKYTEERLILRDAYMAVRELRVSGKGDGYKEYELDDERILRIRVLHPDPPEHKIGADLIYEFHDLESDLVRVCFVQYKLWNGKSLQRDERMERQLSRLAKIGCNGLFCSTPLAVGDRTPYRLPHCAVFLRPTDSLQQRDSRLISSGLHVPLCVANTAWTPTAAGGASLRRANVEKESIDHGLFEDLFYRSFLGSKVVPAAELESVYKEHKVLDDDETLVIHGQEYGIKVEKPPKVKKKSKAKEAG